MMPDSGGIRVEVFFQNVPLPRAPHRFASFSQNSYNLQIMDPKVADLLRRLEEAHDQDDWESVRELAAEVLSIDPDNGDAHAFLRIADLKTGKPDSGAADIGGASEHPDAAIVVAPAPGGRDAFVGRRREAKELKTAFEAVVAGRGSLVLIAGEPGIGKTRIAEELADYVGTRGAHVLWGRIHENSGAPPFWPWVQVIRSYVESVDSEHLRDSLGRGVAVIARIVPEIEDRLEDIPPLPELGDAEAERFRLFDSIACFFKGASSRTPLMIVLDDLHWSDESSLKLLEFLAHEMGESRLLVVGTYRDTDLRRTHPLSKSLGEIGRARQVLRIALRGLSRSEVAGFIIAAAESEVPPELVDTVYAHTEGNPLFAGEVIRYLAQEGALSPGALAGNSAPELRIPEGVREVICRRLDKLSEACNRILRVAAVVGREFDLDLLPGLVDDVDKGAALKAVEEALAIRVVEEVPDVFERYRFSHKLIQDTLAEELTITERVRFHARIAEVLEELHGERTDGHAAELARHFAEAQVLLGTDKLVHYSIVAGKQAEVQTAYEEALAIYRRAADAVKDRPIDDEIAELLKGLRTEQYNAWQVDGAIDTSKKLFDYYESTENVAALAWEAWWLFHLSFFQTRGGGFSADEYCSRSLELYHRKSTDDPWALALLGQLRNSVTGSFEEADAMFERAVSIAERNGDRDLQVQILRKWAYIAMDSRINAAAERYEKAAKIATETSNVLRDGAFHGHFGEINTLLGNSDKARDSADSMMKAAEKLGLPRFKAGACLAKQRLALLRGDFEQVITLFEEGTDILGSSGRNRPEALWLLASAAYADFETGNFDSAVARLEHLVESSEDPGASQFVTGVLSHEVTIPNIARITGDEQWLDAVMAASKAALADDRDAWQAVANLGLIAAVRSDSVAAEKWYSRLIDLGEEIRGYLGHTLGVIARAAGRLEDALAHFDEGYVFTRDAGYHPTHAWICRDRAEALLTRGGDADIARAKVYLDEGAQLTEKLGMKPLRKSIEGLRESFAAAVGPSYPDGLTEREVQVLALVSKGMTNQEIGYELSISTRTVTTHVTNIFEKVGVANRAEATAYAIRNGLVTG